MSLGAIVRHYIRHFRPLAQRELSLFRNQPSDEVAVTMAALAQDDQGRRFSHQRRITRTALEEARCKLVPATGDLAAQRTFAAIHKRVDQLLRYVGGLGVLYRYDTALRIGARFGRLPREVHLHAGTRVGAAALGVDAQQRFLYLSEFPVELRVVEPHEVEDILCIYKSVLGEARVGKPVDLPENDRCYSDDPEDAE